MNLKKECLAIIYFLGEVKWLVIENLYLIIIYSDYVALKIIFIKYSKNNAWINMWLS